MLAAYVQCVLSFGFILHPLVPRMLSRELWLVLCAEPRVLAAYVRCVPSFGFILHPLVPRMLSRIHELLRFCGV